MPSSDIAQSFYESPKLSRARSDVGKRRPHIVSFIRNCVGQDHYVLDVGCGNGINSEIVAQDGNNVVSMDISGANARLARARGLQALQQNAEQPFPFPNETFDRIICIQVLEHLFFPERTVQEIQRCLKPGGKTVISTPNIAFWRNRLFLVFGRFVAVESIKGTHRAWNHPHIRSFTFATLTELLEHNGLKVIESTGNWTDIPGALAPYTKQPWRSLFAGVNKLTGGLSFLCRWYPPLFSGGVWLCAQK